MALANLAIFALLGGVLGVTQGISLAKNGNTFRQKICETYTKATSIESLYNQVIDNEQSVSDTLTDNLQTSIRNLGDLKQQLATVKNSYDSSRNNLVIVSIVLVACIAIALLFKKFGIFELVDQALFGK